MKKISLIEPLHGLEKYEAWKTQLEDADLRGFGDYVSDSCHPEDMLICSQLFIPTFISIDNCILLSDRYEESNFALCKKEFGENSFLIEKTLNHINIYDLFGSIADNVPDIIFEQICNVLKTSWEMVLKELFPEKKFIVESYDPDSGYGPSLTFYQRR